LTIRFLIKIFVGEYVTMCGKKKLQKRKGEQRYASIIEMYIFLFYDVHTYVLVTEYAERQKKLVHYVCFKSLLEGSFYTDIPVIF
jgi:hypothetical protein